MSSRRTFTIEYKRECAEFVINHGYQVNEAAKAMNVGLSSLQKLLWQYRNELNGITSKATAMTAEQKRIQELEAQIKQLKRDNDLQKNIRLLRHGDAQHIAIDRYLKKAGFQVTEICLGLSLPWSVYYASRRSKPT